MDVITLKRRDRKKFRLKTPEQKLREMKKQIELLKYKIEQREKGIQEAEIDIVQWKNLVEELDLIILKRDFDRFEKVFL